MLRFSYEWPGKRGRAHYFMVSKLQCKPFWLATLQAILACKHASHFGLQLCPQNDWTGWQIHLNCDVCAQAPFYEKARRTQMSNTSIGAQPRSAIRKQPNDKICLSLPRRSVVQNVPVLIGTDLMKVVSTTMTLPENVYTAWCSEIGSLTSVDACC